METGKLAKWALASSCAARRGKGRPGGDRKRPVQAGQKTTRCVLFVFASVFFLVVLLLFSLFVFLIPKMVRTCKVTKVQELEE